LPQEAVEWSATRLAMFHHEAGLECAGRDMTLLKKMGVALAIVLLLPGFHWSMILGELDWEKVNRVIDEDFPSIRQLTAEQLRSMLSAGEPVFLVDVRDPEEYRVSHLPGAVLASEWHPQRQDSGALIVAYCSVGIRSAAYLLDLQQQGFRNLYNLRGSIFQWANSGYPLEAEGRRVEKVHPYNARWGKLLRPELHFSEVVEDGGTRRDE